MKIRTPQDVIVEPGALTKEISMVAPDASELKIEQSGNQWIIRLRTEQKQELIEQTIRKHYEARSKKGSPMPHPEKPRKSAEEKAKVIEQIIGLAMEESEVQITSMQKKLSSESADLWKAINECKDQQKEIREKLDRIRNALS